MNGVFNLRTVLPLIVLLLFFVVGCSGDGASLPAKKWTFMLYMDGDETSMERDFITAFNEMIQAEAGSDDNVNIIVQFDRIPGNDESYGNWSICHRFYITPGMEPTEGNAVQNWGDGKGGREVDMADPETLLDFIDWSVVNCPAERYVLMIGDHGYGWQGMCIDTTSYGDFLEVKELKLALDSAPVDIDLLALNACVMQMVEVAYEIRDSGVGIMVGSENLGTSWPIADIIAELTINPGMPTEELGKKINDLYNEVHAGEDGITLSTLDMGGIETLARTIEEFSAALIAGSSDDTVKEKAGAIMAQVEETVFYARNSVNWEGYANGISIYFPLDPEGYLPLRFFYYYTHQITSFARDALWRDFLSLFYNRDTRISTAVYHARFALQSEKREFDDENIDLYDFCRRIVEGD